MPTEDNKVVVPNMGAIPSIPDYRDGVAASAVYKELAAQIEAGDLPDSFKTDLSKLGEVLDQNKVPACVSHAWVIVMKYWWWKKTGELVDFSPRFLDIMSNQPWLGPEDGRYPRDVCRVSAKLGCATTAILPNDTEGLTIAQYRDKSVITDAVLADAAKYKIPGYIRIPDNSISDFRRAIKQLGLVSGLFAISDAFWKPTWQTKDIDPLQARTPSSNHQMVVYGWEGSLNWLRNSWSKLWNRAGDGTFKASTWLDYIIEGWAIAEVPADLPGFMSKLPAPPDFHYQWNKDLNIGEFSDDIKMAQIALMILGLMQPVPPDQLGYFGAKTSKAVYAYQTLKKIPITDRNANRIGPKTRSFLNAEFTV